MIFKMKEFIDITLYTMIIIKNNTFNRTKSFGSLSESFSYNSA